MIEDKIYSYFDRNPGLHVLFFFDPKNERGRTHRQAMAKELNNDVSHMNQKRTQNG